MPTVRFQVTALHCSKTEDWGLLDSRSEDEVYLHGAVWSAERFKVFLIGTPGPSHDAAFQYLTIQDGQTLEFEESEDNGWVVDLPEDAQLVVGLAAHEEDAQRKWPTSSSLRQRLDEEVGKVARDAQASGNLPKAEDLVTASTSVMKTLEKSEVDDFLGKLVLDGLAVRDLLPENFDRACAFAGGTRVLASDFAYTLYYRVSRDNRDFAVELMSPARIAAAFRPEETSSLEVAFRNKGRAAFTSDDVVLIAPRELLGWLPEGHASVTSSSDAVGILASQTKVNPDGTLTFTIPVSAPQALVKAIYGLKLYVPSLKYFIPHEVISLELASGRNMVCSVETVSLNGGLNAEIRVIARDAETQEILEGTVSVTGDKEEHRTSSPISIQSNMHRLVQEPIVKGGGDGIVWPFANVQVDAYWPQLIPLTPP